MKDLVLIMIRSLNFISNRIVSVRVKIIIVTSDTLIMMIINAWLTQRLMTGNYLSRNQNIAKIIIGNPMGIEETLRHFVKEELNMK